MIIRDKGKRLPKSINVRCFNRPMKVAYLVPTSEAELSHWILDGIFSEAYSRWGGSRSLIIPCHEGKPLDSGYEKWLSLLDPDFIYSYVDLTTESIDSLNRIALPVAFLKHNLENISGWRDCIPSWSTYIVPVPAASTMTSPYAENPGWSQVPTPRVYLVQHLDNSESRFLPDNFAVSLSTSMSMLGQKEVYETVCYMPSEVPNNYIIGTYRCSSLTEIVNKLAKKEARSISVLSSIHCNGVFRPNDWQWCSSFHIIIGDSVLDRVNFWNIRHFSSGGAGGYVPSSLIISPSLIEDDDFCKAVGSYLNTYNFLGRSNSSPTAYVTSNSISRECCTELITNLREAVIPGVIC